MGGEGKLSSRCRSLGGIRKRAAGSWPFNYCTLKNLFSAFVWINQQNNMAELFIIVVGTMYMQVIYDETSEHSSKHSAVLNVKQANCLL